jgi:hypothetical protein
MHCYGLFVIVLIYTFYITRVVCCSSYCNLCLIVIFIKSVIA